MGRNIRFGLLVGLGMAAMGGAYAQTIPTAPDAPTCTMTGGQSNCRFKPEIEGTPTSIKGNRVILFNRSANGGHGDSRRFAASALGRLATRYGFTGTVTEDPAIFTAANLANTKVVIMSNGDGDVLPAGANRTALENFQQVNGWGVIWIHAACAFITNGWPFGQNSCVQQYNHHNPSNTSRRVFIDSGTTAAPNHGIKNPQSEFVLRSIPSWTGRTYTMGDEYYCFRAPARSTAGVNVLLGYDRSSGLPPSACPEGTANTTAASQNHNLAWTRFMGKGIAIYNSIGHDDGTYTGGQNMGDSLLWRFIRYAAKDWEVATPTGFIAKTERLAGQTESVSGALVLEFTDSQRNAVTVTDITGKQVFARNFAGVNRAEVPNLQRGIYFVKVASAKTNEVKRVRVI